MKVLLMSDSHLMRGLDAVVLLENADINLHMGDSQLMKNNLEMEHFDYAVRGNCDFERFDEHAIVSIDDKRWLLVHGHQVYNAHDLESLSDLAKSYDCQVICYGHTHIPVYSKVSDVIILNPGSLARSRSKYPNSYMTVDITNGMWTVLLKHATSSVIIEELKINE